MPEQLSMEEVNQKIEEAIKEVNPTSMRDMGKLMAYLNPILKAKTDMSEVSKLIKDKLANLQISI